MSAQIQIVIGPDRGRTFVLPANGTLNIGRSNTTDTQLTDLSVSRLHCRIDFDGARATLVNVSSKGTMVNAKPATAQELRHGDLIRIGNTEIRFAVVAMAEAETLVQHGSDQPSVSGIDSSRPVQNEPTSEPRPLGSG